MAKSEVINFFDKISKNQQELDRLSSRNLSEIIFHSKSMGYTFTTEELTCVVGAMEWYIITEKDKEELNAYSKLWKRMWGKSRLNYIIEDLFSRLKMEEISGIIQN